MSPRDPSEAPAPREAAAQAGLIASLRDLPGAVVAFSGGVDSAVLAHACLRALGPEGVLAVTARSPSLPLVELEGARRLAEEIGVEHLVLDSDELSREGYRRNASDRCYHCKSELFEVVDREVRAVGERSGWPVLFGAIADDLADHRPGARAARERGVLAPLADHAFDKAMVRHYARAHGLSVADKPSFACLASRVPYGTEVHAEVLARIERAEDALRWFGFRQFRVRHHDTVARVEVEPAEILRLVELRDEVVAELRAAGYAYVTVDLQGFRSGSMNEVL